MAQLKIIEKVKRKVWQKIVANTKNKSWYPKLYKSYWHYFFSAKNIKEAPHHNYLSSVPNPGAGIGHQMANYIAGYWFANLYSLQFAHTSFTGGDWEAFLGFGENEVKVSDLLSKGYNKVLLPLFDEYNEKQIASTRKIIASYAADKVIFITEQDQGYKNQYDVIEHIKTKFNHAVSRRNDRLIYNSDHFNIAIHVRRGDITVGQINGNPNLTLRWQNNDYFVNVLRNVVEKLETTKPISIYLFSQGKLEDFTDFKEFESVNYCLDMPAQQSFLHMVFADLLITSKSSFSYKPALLSNGIKICPKYFWHGYPDNESWILAEEDGSFSKNRL